MAVPSQIGHKSAYGSANDPTAHILRSHAKGNWPYRSQSEIPAWAPPHPQPGISAFRGACPDTFINVDYRWHPKIDVCWDIRRGLPFRSGSIAGIFTEHCIEHLSLFAPDFGLNGPCSKLLIECRRVLRPGSIIRVVVPDARIYLGTYVQRTGGKADKLFPYEPAGSDWLPILHVNRVFYDGRQFAGGHCTMFDFDLLAQVLTTAGFLDVKRKAFQSGEDEMLLIDSPGREPESIYIEATR